MGRLSEEELYMQRCFDLARMGIGNVSPNPAVGAVVVSDHTIIGEGWHRAYGTAHAEVNAFASVKPEHLNRLETATLYVSLEPCCTYGNTPPCTNLILEKKLKKVLVASIDQSPGVSGRGIRILREAGISVEYPVAIEKGDNLSAVRNIYVTKQRPYIILKYAVSNDGFLGRTTEQVWLTNRFSNKLVHKWRSEVDAILVGTQTALLDNPQLTNRHFWGKSPIRVVIDRLGNLPDSLRLFDGTVRTIVISAEDSKTKHPKLIESIKMDFENDFLHSLLTKLAERKITTLLVEGGAYTLQQFIDAGLWDEARVFTAPVRLGSGVTTPLIAGKSTGKYVIDTDELEIFTNQTAGS